MSDDHALVPTRPEDFPPAVHESLAALRQLAQQAKSLEAWKATGRKATDAEVALAKTLQQPYHCHGSSVRTGLPCTRKAIKGSTVCPKHLGATKRFKAAAERRLLRASKVVADQMVAFALDTNPKVRAAAQKAAADVLDRNEIGALVKAKVQQAANGSKSAGGVTVQIGFISPDGAQTAIKVETE